MAEAAMRHWSVLRAAWTLDREDARTRRRRRETEFLPAALEVIETPASPLGRTLLWALIALLGVALMWSFVGRLDVVAVALGRVVPVDQVKLIQPAELGVVRAIHVREGQQVKAGQVLIELDPTVAGADDVQAERGLLASRIEAARARALIAHAEGRGGSGSAFVAPAGTPPQVAAVQRALVERQIADFDARRSALAQQRREHEADRQGSLAERAKMADTLPLLERQVEARRTLTEKGYSSKLQLLQLEEELIERRRNVDVHAASAARAAASISRVDQELRQMTTEFVREAAQKLAEAEDNALLRTQEFAKTGQRRMQQRLTSSVDGTVHQLAVHTLGGVVQPAERLMTVVPASGGLIVEANVLNKDIGFVREGQPVRVKVDAFPFTEHGTLDGVVEHVARNAREDEKLGLVYGVRVAVNSQQANHNLRTSAIAPGMSVQAEVRTGERRVIDYLLGPISRTVSSAGQER